MIQKVEGGQGLRGGEERRTAVKGREAGKAEGEAALRRKREKHHIRHAGGRIHNLSASTNADTGSQVRQSLMTSRGAAALRCSMRWFKEPDLLNSPNGAGGIEEAAPA